MTRPYTIKMFVPGGNPEQLKIIDKMNWTGVGLDMSRSAWATVRNRQEFDRAGVYVLIGSDESSELPKVYIGQGDCIRDRIDSHAKNKIFWSRAIAFTSSGSGLNRAHATWLESLLIQRALEARQCNLENLATPREPYLSESERSDIDEFYIEMLGIFPLLNILVFERPKNLAVGHLPPELSAVESELDTIVVPAQEEGFKDVFLGENCWYSIRIGGGKLDQIRYIAAYRTAPVSAVTHYAPVSAIEPYGDSGKYRLIFSEPAKEVGPIVLAGGSGVAPQSARYTTIDKLKSAKYVGELWDTSKANMEVGTDA